MKQEMISRLTAKTKEQQLLHILQREFQQPPRVARAILQDVQECLQGTADQVGPGQMRVVLVAMAARHGEALPNTLQKEVMWTVDAGKEDYEVNAQYGAPAMRQQRIQRLLVEAVEQGAVASQEDLARVLHVSVRTIKRDCAALAAQGVYLPTRGNLKGIGRGQTHKALIVGRWLRGQTYDQIARATHHSIVSVQRYVQMFRRVIHLHQQGVSLDEIALLLQVGWPLVADYLAIYEKHDTPFVRERLKTQLQRFQRRTQVEKKRGA
jgi:DNA-binding Lrp family transcriptional regulator